MLNDNRHENVGKDQNDEECYHDGFNFHCFWKKKCATELKFFWVKAGEKRCATECNLGLSTTSLQGARMGSGRSKYLYLYLYLCVSVFVFVFVFAFVCVCVFVNSSVYNLG